MATAKKVTAAIPTNNVGGLLAIDPGIGGAIAYFFNNGFVEVLDMPVRVKKSGRREVDAQALHTLVRAHALAHAHDKFRCVIEQVSAGPGQGVSSMFSFGHSFGVVAGVAEGYAQVAYVAASKWKAALALTSNKAYSLTQARRLYPTAHSYLTRKKDEGRAEAILLGRFALLTPSLF